MILCFCVQTGTENAEALLPLLGFVGLTRVGRVKDGIAKCLLCHVDLTNAMRCLTALEVGVWRSVCRWAVSFGGVGGGYASSQSGTHVCSEHRRSDGERDWCGNEFREEYCDTDDCWLSDRLWVSTSLESSMVDWDFLSLGCRLETLLATFVAEFQRPSSHWRTSRYVKYQCVFV